RSSGPLLVASVSPRGCVGRGLSRDFAIERAFGPALIFCTRPQSRPESIDLGANLASRRVALDLPRIQQLGNDGGEAGGTVARESRGRTSRQNQALETASVLGLE